MIIDGSEISDVRTPMICLFQYVCHYAHHCMMHSLQLYTINNNYVIPVTYAKETGAINWLHFPGASFWYVCYANLVTDSSGTRFRRQLGHCAISSVHITEMMTYDWSMITAYLFYNLITNYEFIIYVAFIDFYFWRWKCSFQTHMILVFIEHVCYVHLSKPSQPARRPCNVQRHVTATYKQLYYYHYY